ncbi:(2Fe-2S)-binding protein [Acidocella facilis]|uniref:(2Fe-2S)-binding protein n=1 Tax=Acidocella facilis TaxID=525 RepID=UPI001F30DCB6|nr:(2Fe-2S)-binding protein [Acidocella facilis]
MFKRIETLTAPVRFTFEGQAIEARPGESIAAALLAAGVAALRDTPVSGAPRAPYCMMGVCFDCLVEINGMPNQQACLTAATPGLVVRRQRGARQFDLSTAEDGQ